MNILQIFRVPADGQDSYEDRPTVKAIVLNDANEVALFPGLPGGGVEKGETLEEALHRECMEELGMMVEIIQPLGITEQYRDAIKKHYIVHGFLAKKVGDLTTPTSTDPDDIELDFQSRLQWLPINEAIAFTTMRIETLERGESPQSYDLNRKDDYFQNRIYNAKTVLVFLEQVKRLL
jgi:ADP-ribose pyrophosphatase YjhB (NUDIX family)